MQTKAEQGLVSRRTVLNASTDGKLMCRRRLCVKARELDVTLHSAA